MVRRPRIRQLTDVLAGHAAGFVNEMPRESSALTLMLNLDHVLYALFDDTSSKRRSRPIACAERDRVCGGYWGVAGIEKTIKRRTACIHAPHHLDLADFVLLHR